jgi:DegV family protein with EDD domain
MEAAARAREGKSAPEILAFLEDCFCRTEIYLGVYSLDFAKRSGRIGAATAFVGDVLGLRPVISMIDGSTKVVDRVRGERNLAPRIFSIYKEQLIKRDSRPLVVCGSEPEWGEQLACLLKEELGAMPPVYRAGAAITINAGPRMVALVARGKTRPPHGV